MAVESLSFSTELETGRLVAGSGRVGSRQDEHNQLGAAAVPKQTVDDYCGQK